MPAVTGSRKEFGERCDFSMRCFFLNDSAGCIKFFPDDGFSRLETVSSSELEGVLLVVTNEPTEGGPHSPASSRLTMLQITLP